MFKYAVRCDIRPSEFWELTPREIFLVCDAYAEKKQAELEKDVSIAYIGARIVMAKKPPTLQELLKSLKQNEQTPDDMLNVVRKLNAQLGGKIVVKEVK